MDTCAICRSELAAEWNFCVHCGTPVPPRTPVTATAAPTTAVAAWQFTAMDDTFGATVTSVPGFPQHPDRELDPIPSAIRPEPVPRSSQRVDARLAFGIAMAAVGLLVVVYAVISLLGANG